MLCGVASCLCWLVGFGVVWDVKVCGVCGCVRGCWSVMSCPCGLFVLYSVFVLCCVHVCWFESGTDETWRGMERLKWRGKEMD